MAVEPHSTEAVAGVNLDPGAARLFEEAQPRRPKRLSWREQVVESAFALVFLAASLAFALLVDGQRDWNWLDAAALVVAFTVLSRVTFDVGGGYTVPTQLVLVPLLFLVPVTAVPPLVAVALLLGRLPAYLRGETHPERALLVAADALYSFAPALVIAFATDGDADLGDWPIYLLALAAQFALDSGLAVLREWLEEGVAPKLQVRLVMWIYLVDACLAPIGLLAALAGQDDHGVAALLVLPLALLLIVFARERRERIEQSVALSNAYRGTALLLGDVIGGDDAYTGEHTQGVHQLALALADEVGANDRVKMDIEFGALLHDVGKLAVPKEIINKTGPLDDDEWAVIRTHTIEGERMLARVGGVLAEVGRVVRSSHERWDGGGYPDGLAGRAIPYAARMVAVCDAFSAMTTDRPYRPAMSVTDAIAQLRGGAGTQFDPDVVTAFVRVVERTNGLG